MSVQRRNQKFEQHLGQQNKAVEEELPSDLAMLLEKLRDAEDGR